MAKKTDQPKFTQIAAGPAVHGHPLVYALDESGKVWGFDTSTDGGKWSALPETREEIPAAESSTD
jgi:hypothetical protein